MNSIKLKEYFGVASLAYFIMAALVLYYGSYLPEFISPTYIVFCLSLLSLVYAGMGEGICKTITFIGFLSIGPLCLLALTGLLDFLFFEMKCFLFLIVIITIFVYFFRKHQKK